MASENESPGPDPYAILGIHRAATPQEIRRAYRRKTKATHPDRFDKVRQPYEWQKANQKQAELNRAYAALRSGRGGRVAMVVSPSREHAPRANRGSGARRATEDRQDHPNTRQVVLLLWRITGVSLLNGIRQSIIVEAATAEEAAAIALTKSIRAISIAAGPARSRPERPTRATYRLTSLGRKAVVACILAVVCLVTAWAVQLAWYTPTVWRQSSSASVRSGDDGRSGSDRRMPLREATPDAAGPAVPLALPEDPLTPGIDLLNRSKPTSQPAK